jgi:DNA-binding PadR family transcriptional regulator
MPAWLRSGLRRDVCVFVFAQDAPTGQQLKSAVELHYDERIEPKSFYGAIDALVDTGHLVRETNGLADRYRLTDAGERALLAHREWFCETVSADEEKNGNRQR